MTYKKLADIAAFLGRLGAEQFARDYVAVKRDHVRRVREKIDALANNADYEERRVWGLGYVD